MPRIIDEEEEEEDEESQFEEDEELERRGRGRPPKRIERDLIRESTPIRESKEREEDDDRIFDIPPKKNQQKPESKRRFGIIPAQPPRLVDTESNEILAEGDYLVPQTLTDILERLERLENAIGSMIK